MVMAALCVVACNRRAGLNFDCMWVPDPPTRLDVLNKADTQHFLDDLRVAEELAMRYGDRMAGTRLIETFGIVSRHGGTKERDLGRRSRQACVNTLLRTISITHGIAMADVEGLRPRLDDRGVDLAVTGPAVLILALAVWRFTRWIRNRFESDEWAAWAVATLFASLLIPVVVLAFSGAWAIVVEIIRLGNEHVGNRARIEGLRPHVIALLGIGVAAVWFSSGMVPMRKRAEVPTSHAPAS